MCMMCAHMHTHIQTLCAVQGIRTVLSAPADEEAVCPEPLLQERRWPQGEPCILSPSCALTGAMHWGPVCDHIHHGLFVCGVADGLNGVQTHSSGSLQGRPPSRLCVSTLRPRLCILYKLSPHECCDLSGPPSKSASPIGPAAHPSLGSLCGAD